MTWAVKYSRWEHTQSKELSGNGELSELSGERCPYSPDQRLVCKYRKPAPIAATRQGKLGLRGTRGLLGTDLDPPYGGSQMQPLSSGRKPSQGVTEVGPEPGTGQKAPEWERDGAGSRDAQLRVQAGGLSTILIPFFWSSAALTPPPSLPSRVLSHHPGTPWPLG